MSKLLTRHASVAARVETEASVRADVDPAIECVVVRVELAEDVVALELEVGCSWREEGGAVKCSKETCFWPDCGVAEGRRGLRMLERELLLDEVGCKDRFEWCASDDCDFCSTGD